MLLRFIPLATASFICLPLFMPVTWSQSSQADTVVYNNPQAGGPRRFQVTEHTDVRFYTAPSTDATNVSISDNSMVLNNLGCELTHDRVWCHIESLHTGIKAYTLSEFIVPAVGPDGIVPMGPDESSRQVRKGKFDAANNVSCAQVQGQSMHRCTARIARSGGGDASVVVTFSNGFSRTLFFTHGEFVSANATMSGVGNDTDWSMEDGFHYIRVDDQRYEIPHSFILGTPLKGID